MAAAWSRVFGSLDQNPDPARLERATTELVPLASVHLKGDDLGWYHAEIRWGQGSPLTIETYGAADPSVRNDLNTWAAYIETCDYSPNVPMLMEKVALARQVITLRRPIDHQDELGLDRLMSGLAQHLALETDGVYQIDEAGFFDKNGGLLLEEF
jgi:hypothetical protein